MRLTWHIIAKDLRQDKWALGFWVALFALHLAVGFAFLNTDGTDLEWIDQLRWANLLLRIFEFAIGYLLALRWVQADELSGTRMFWVTRPISGARLLTAKALGLLLVFGLLPLAIWLPWWIQSGASVREIGWLAVETFAWQLLVISPALLIGSLTDDFGRALMWSLVLMLAVVAWSIIGQSTLTAPGFTQYIRAYPGVWFSRLFVGVLLLVVGFAAIAANQFLVRNSLRSLVRVGVLGLLVIGVGRFWLADISDVFDRPGNLPAVEPIPGLVDRIALSVNKARLSTFSYKTRTANGPEDVRPLMITFEVTGLPEDLVLGGEHPFQELQWTNGPAFRSPERNHSFPTQVETILRKRLSLPPVVIDPETARWGQARLIRVNAERALKGLEPLGDYWAAQMQLQPPEPPALGIRFPVPESTIARLRSQLPGYHTVMNAQVGRWDVTQMLSLTPGARGTGLQRTMRLVNRDDWVVRMVETTAAYPREGLFFARARVRPNPARPELRSVNQHTGDTAWISGRNPVQTAITVGGVAIKWIEATLTPARWIRNDQSVIKDPNWADHTRIVVMTATEVGRFTREIRTERLVVEFPPEPTPAATPPESSAGTGGN